MTLSKIVGSESRLMELKGGAAAGGTASNVSSAVATMRRAGSPPATLGVLILGADFQALGILRALAEAGIPSFLVATEPGIAAYSRYAKRKASRSKLFHVGEAGAKYLLELARDESLEGWTIACVDDDGVEFLARNHSRLSQRFELPVPDWSRSEKFFKKSLSFQVAQKAGIPVPRQYDASSLESLRRQQILFPVVLKPSFKKDYYDKTKVKGILVSSSEELVSEYNQMLELIPSSQIVVQEFLPGGTQNLYSFAVLFDGEKVLQGASVRRLQAAPHGFWTRHNLRPNRRCTGIRRLFGSIP